MFLKSLYMNLIIDVGNTSTKAAVFNGDILVQLYIFDKRRIISEIKKIRKEYWISGGIMSSVSNISDKKMERLGAIVPILTLSSKTKTPFKNLYATPETLGVDRIALVAAAVKKYPDANVLVIDAGTCITFDFITAEKEYLGGAISPGIAMRYKSLHTFTSKLPLLKKDYPKNFTGNSTKQSINAGIVNGILHEIEGTIAQYREKYGNLTVVLTGGDTNFLAKQLKSSIFANQNFLLEGLNAILIFNKKE